MGARVEESEEKKGTNQTEASKEGCKTDQRKSGNGNFLVQELLKKGKKNEN